MAQRSRTRDPDAVRPPEVSLSDLPVADDAVWRAGPEYDGVDFVGLDEDAYEAGSTRFVECRISGARFGHLGLRRSRLIGSEIAELQATTLDVADSDWTDVVVRGGRLGALLAAGTTATRVAMRGVRANYVNLRGATIVDLTLVDCRIGELDLGTADVQRADLGGSEIERLVLSGARLQKVDLSRSEIGEIEGVAELRGATISALQLVRLAPALAAQLGIRVSD